MGSPIFDELTQRHPDVVEPLDPDQMPPEDEHAHGGPE
jgi:hypothetical protein